MYEHEHEHEAGGANADGRTVQLMRSIVYYEWKLAQLGNPAGPEQTAEAQVYRRLARHRRALLADRAR